MKRKTLLTAILITMACSVFAQHDPCGTWLKEPPVYSEWETFDTLGSMTYEQRISIIAQRFGAGLGPVWVYSTEESYFIPSWITLDGTHWGGLLEDCPMTRSSDVFEQFRIDKFTGIRQRRTKTVGYRYQPPALNDYQKLRDSFGLRSIPSRILGSGIISFPYQWNQGIDSSVWWSNGRDTAHIQFGGITYAHGPIDSIITSSRFLRAPNTVDSAFTVWHLHYARKPKHKRKTKRTPITKAGWTWNAKDAIWEWVDKDASGSVGEGVVKPRAELLPRH